MCTWFIYPFIYSFLFTDLNPLGIKGPSNLLHFYTNLIGFSFFYFKLNSALIALVLIKIYLRRNKNFHFFLLFYFLGFSFLSLLLLNFFNSFCSLGFRFSFAFQATSEFLQSYKNIVRLRFRYQIQVDDLSILNLF